MPNKTLEKWEEKTLEDLCEIEIGKTPNRSTPKFWDKELITDNTWLSIADLNNTLNKAVFTSKERISDIGASNIKIVKQGTLLLSFKLTIGRVAFAGKNLYTNEAIAQFPIKNPKEIDKNYLYYYLQYFNYDKLLRGDVKVKGKALNKEKLKALPVLYPELSEQQRIVEILDVAFENIEKAKQNALQNLNNAKELFESCLDELFTKNTDNWNKYKVKDLCEYAKEQGHYNLPYVGMEHIKSSAAEFIGTLDNTEVKSTTFHFDKGIILYGRLRPYLRKVILTTFEGHCSTELFPIKVNDKVNNKFLMYWLLSQRITDKINATWTGARMPRANMNKVLEFDISIPSIMEQQKIVVQLDELQEQTKKLEQIYEQKIKDLDELKQSILQKAFNGKL